MAPAERPDQSSETILPPPARAVQPFQAPAFANAETILPRTPPAPPPAPNGQETMLPAAQRTNVLHAPGGIANDATLVPPARPPDLGPAPTDGPRRAGGTEHDTQTQQAVRPTASPAPLPRMAGYELLKVLGRGGMGVVYLARQTGLNRLVALKMLLNSAHAGEDERQRFEAEARAIAALRHPNVVQVYDVGEHEGRPYCALEYVSGGSLDKALGGVPRPPREAARLLAVLARAMDAVHARGLIHRDLKPANVLIQGSTEDAEATEPGATAGPAPSLFSGSAVVKITDFGLVKRLDEGSGQTRTGDLMGTPSYMAPEQALGQRDVGVGADIYALGAMLYEALTGRPPFRGPSAMETVRMVLEAEAVAVRKLQPAVPRDLETICHKCLQKQPGHRYLRARDLADDLQRFLDGLPIRARPVPWYERGWKWAKRRPALATGLAAAAIVTAGLGVGGLAWYEAARDAEVRDLQELGVKQVRGRNLLLAAQAAAGQGALAEAQGHLEELQGLMNLEPRLADLGGPRDALRRRVDQALAERKAREAAQATAAADRADLARFLRLRDEAFFFDAGLTGLDHRDNLQAVRRHAHEALAVFPAGPPASLDAAQRAAVVEGRYELALVLAAATAEPLPGEAAEAQARAGLALLDQAAAGRPATHAWFTRRALCLERLDDRQGGQAARARAAELPPTTALDHFLTGQERMGDGDLPAAIAHFRAARELRPDHFWAQYLLAACYLRSPQAYLGPAIAELTGCQARRPDVVQTYLLRGFAYGELGNFADAAADYRRAADLLKQAPSPGAALVLQASRGVLEVRLGKAAEERQPAAAREHYAAALADFTAARALQPQQYVVHANLSQALAGLGRTAEARAALDEAVKLQPNLARLYATRAKLQAEPAAALADYEAALRLEVQGSPAWNQDQAERARALFQLRRFAEAVTAARAALAGAEPTSRVAAVAAEVEAKALLELKRYPEVIAAATAFLQAAATARPADRAALHWARGLAQAGRGQFPEALADYTQALALGPDDPNALRVARGWVYLLTDAPKLALADFEAVLKDAPDHADALNGRGHARVKLGRVAQGTADADHAVHLAGQDSRTLYNAARTYAQAIPAAEGGSAHAGQALGLLRRALDLMPAPARAGFWRETVQKDAALAPLRRQPAFTFLEQQYGGK